MYRTGDLGKWRKDGTIEFRGRNDFQVKLRGFRIELNEIEARLAEYPGVRDAVVICSEDKSGEKRLLAYYTARESVEPEQLRSHVAASLPEYMVPAAYMKLDALPLNASGKIDRKALPDPEGNAYATGGNEPLRSSLEKALAGIWAELLQLKQPLGRNANFFELGGHSLLAVRTVARIRQSLGVEITLSDLFAHPRLGDLGARLEVDSRPSCRLSRLFNATGSCRYRLRSSGCGSCHRWRV